MVWAKQFLFSLKTGSKRVFEEILKKRNSSVVKGKESEMTPDRFSNAVGYPTQHFKILKCQAHTNNPM